ncbi:hypothetical protein H6F86_01240 [Phormidium sp. FACHB-592]|uniref:Uncharacterized protein n=1 Tax=Stenomitos frigidus AS-A4 TaxID=2933935 RepID=A0ABV0KT34_9CYAN|nr:hypothetical protein [Phormidium sp. FACHB-592]MBD2072559.1 hypothetical protein [Phormidium sp. FACHB-592]
MVTTLTPPTLMHQTECISSKVALEVALTQFIHGALRATATGQYSGDTAIVLLDPSGKVELKRSFVSVVKLVARKILIW